LEDIEGWNVWPRDSSSYCVAVPETSFDIIINVAVRKIGSGFLDLELLKLLFSLC